MDRNIKRLLYLGPPETLRHVSQELDGLLTVDLALDEDAVDNLLGSADAVLDAYMRVRFPAARLAAASNLKLFVTATTGADHIDAASLEERGIPLLTLKGQREVLKNITPAAEHSWLLLMACARRLLPAAASVRDGQWDRNQFPGIMLRGKVMGLVGCGRIGQWMARYATAFGLSCLGYDPFLEEWPETIQPASLEKTLAAADFIGVHVPFSDQNRGLIGVDQLAVVKPSAVLINTSRGEILDEAALLRALEGGRLAAAGLDVLAGEPDIFDHPLRHYARAHDNLIITPHIGGFSPDALRFVLAFSCGRLRDHFGGSDHT